MSGDDPYKDARSPWVQPPLKAKKGRGAVSNMQGCYEVLAREAVDDGWPRGITEPNTEIDATGDNTDAHSRNTETEADSSLPLRTQVIEEWAKSILSRNQSPDVPFSVSLNPYRGCEHGCIYCFARPTHSYLGLSPGLDFESKIFAKVNAPQLLRRELAKASYVPEPIAL
ncbi:MAG: radical SAM protein, partial [Nitrosospira sp.]